MATRLWIVVGLLAVIFVFTTLWAVQLRSSLRESATTKPARGPSKDLKHIQAERDQLRVFPQPIWKMMQTAEVYLAFAIDPDSKHSRESDPTTQKAFLASDTPRELHGFSVIGRVAIADSDTRSTLSTTVRAGIEQWDGSMSLCMFQPRHAIRMIKGQRVVDILICYHCGDVFIYDTDGEKVDRRFIVRKVPPVFDEVLNAASIRVAE